MSGANDILSDEDIRNANSVITSASVCVCQLEINPEVTHYTLSVAKKAGGKCHRDTQNILPMHGFTDSLYNE